MIVLRIKRLHLLLRLFHVEKYYRENTDTPLFGIPPHPSLSEKTFRVSQLTRRKSDFLDFKMMLS